MDVKLLVNTDDIVGTLAADTWLKPFDSRQYRVRAAPEYPKKYEFIPVDFGHSIGNPNWTANSLSGQVDDIVVPDAVVDLEREDLAPFIEKLRAFAPENAAEFMGQIPDDWLNSQEQSSLEAYLAGRAVGAASALDGAYPETGGS